jgi:hypothetical protein
MTLVETFPGESDAEFRAAMDAVVQAVSPERPKWWHPYEVRGTYEYGGVRFRDFHCVAGSVEGWIHMQATKGGSRRVIMVPDASLVVFGGVTMVGGGQEVPAAKEQIKAVMEHPPPRDILSYDTPSVRTRMGIPSAVLANIILLVDSFLAGMLCFSLLPASVAILALPINASAFIIWRWRFGMGSYLIAIHCITILLLMLFLILVATFGRESFEWLFDWA